MPDFYVNVGRVCDLRVNDVGFLVCRLDSNAKCCIKIVVFDAMFFDG